MNPFLMIMSPLVLLMFVLTSAPWVFLTQWSGHRVWSTVYSISFGWHFGSLLHKLPFSSYSNFMVLYTASLKYMDKKTFNWFHDFSEKCGKLLIRYYLAHRIQQRIPIQNFPEFLSQFDYLWEEHKTITNKQTNKQSL